MSLNISLTKLKSLVVFEEDDVKLYDSYEIDRIHFLDLSQFVPDLRESDFNIYYIYCEYFSI